MGNGEPEPLFQAGIYGSSSACWSPPSPSYQPSPWHQDTNKGRPHFPGSKGKSTLTGGKITVFSAFCDGQRMLCWQEGRSQCDKGKKSACVTCDSLKDPISLTQLGHKNTFAPPQKAPIFSMTLSICRNPSYVLFTCSNMWITERAYKSRWQESFICFSIKHTREMSYQKNSCLYVMDAKTLGSCDWEMVSFPWDGKLVRLSRCSWKLLCLYEILLLLSVTDYV